MEKRQITFSLSQKDWEVFDKLAKEDNRSKASYIRNLVFKKLKGGNQD